MGNLLAVIVHAANIHDTKSGISVAESACQRYRSLKKFCADAGCRGAFVRELWEKLSLKVDVSERIKPHEWERLPRRWRVERTFSWLNHSHRLSKDYEISTASAAAMLTPSHLHTLLKRM